MSRAYKSVSLVIEVPAGKHCWDGDGPCEYFDNEGGHGRCTLGVGFNNVKDNKRNWDVLKDPKCASLREVIGE